MRPFLKEHPRDVGLEGYNDDSRSLTTKMISDEGEDNVTTEVDATIGDVKSKKRSMSICEGLWIGIRIPGVLEFSCVSCLQSVWPTPLSTGHRTISHTTDSLHRRQVICVHLWMLVVYSVVLLQDFFRID